MSCLLLYQLLVHVNFNALVLIARAPLSQVCITSCCYKSDSLRTGKCPRVNKELLAREY